MLYIKNTDTNEILQLDATEQEFNDIKADKLANNITYPYRIAKASEITAYNENLLLIEQNKAQELFLKNKQKTLDNINSMLDSKLENLSKLGNFMNILLIDKFNPTAENSIKLNTLYDSTKSIIAGYDILVESITNATTQENIDNAIEIFKNI
jgi:hypothetical protein